MVPRREIKENARKKLINNISGMIGAEILFRILKLGILCVLSIMAVAATGLSCILMLLPTVGFIFLIVPVASTYIIGNMISEPVQVGLNRYFLYIKKYSVKGNIRYILDGFNNYWNITKASALRWILIFAIPILLGVVEMLVLNWTASFDSDILYGNFGLEMLVDMAQSLVSCLQIMPFFLLAQLISGYYVWLKTWTLPWVLAEHPDLAPKKAVEVSCQLTTGKIGNIFVYELSFIGWRILDKLTSGIVGLLYYKPYYNMTCAEMYAALKGEPIEWTGNEFIQDELKGKSVAGTNMLHEKKRDNNSCGDISTIKLTPTIYGVCGQYKGYSFKLKPDEQIIIGRDAENASIVLDSKYARISRRHCAIRYVSKSQKYELLDLSRNGIFVDGKRLPNEGPVYLDPGTVIELDRNVLAFKLL